MNIETCNARSYAILMLAGQLLYIGITQLHVGGDANNHPVIFADYAGSASWTLVHFGQFASMSILLTGLIGFGFTLEAPLEKSP